MGYEACKAVYNAAMSALFCTTHYVLLGISFSREFLWAYHFVFLYKYDTRCQGFNFYNGGVRYDLYTKQYR